MGCVESKQTSDRSFSQPSSFQTKSPATLPCTILHTQHLIQNVLMKVSQILVVVNTFVFTGAENPWSQTGCWINYDFNRFLQIDKRIEQYSPKISELWIGLFSSWFFLLVATLYTTLMPAKLGNILFYAFIREESGVALVQKDKFRWWQAVSYTHLTLPTILLV